MATRRMTSEEVWILAWYGLIDNIIEIVTFGYVFSSRRYRKYEQMVFGRMGLTVPIDRD